MRLIIDADPIVYRAGFAAEQTDYHVVAETQDGEVKEAYFTAKPPAEGQEKGITAGEQMKAWLEDKEVLAKDRVVTPEPVENCLQMVHSTIQGIIDAAKSKFKRKKLDVVVLLSGPGNYREKLATIKPYKGNRDADHKPTHYQAIRNYLTDHWGAEVVHGCEADDRCSQLAHEFWEQKRWEAFVVATIDKDLDQVPGHHYDYAKHVWYFVSDQYSQDFFWRQVLCGDPTDNIPGIYKLGSKGAEKIVNEWRELGLSDTGIWNAVVNQYMMARDKSGYPYGDRDPAEMALENARLVYMQRKPGELWMPPPLAPGKLEPSND